MIPPKRFDLFPPGGAQKVEMHSDFCLLPQYNKKYALDLEKYRYSTLLLIHIDSSINIGVLSTVRRRYRRPCGLFHITVVLHVLMSGRGRMNKSSFTLEG